ncbi:sugar transferase [Pontibacter sp. KCTC 32443]|uniref:sugar transferase n=1 Tax=Pontibacter TaxID=323449 RepID=UPI00164E27BF|nr:MULTISPECIES: sugar transferase [Pontibacter]MBC5774894.1 sugar transferase [Pontibacter sp. KCTC 32443]
MNSTTTVADNKVSNTLGYTLFIRVLALLTNNKKSLSFEVTDRKYLLFTVDLLLVVTAAFTYCVAVYNSFTLEVFLGEKFTWLVSVILWWSLLSYIFDLYNLEYINKFYTTVKYLTVATTITIIGYLFFPWHTPELPTSKYDILLFIFQALTSLVVWRYLYSRLFNRPIFLKRVLVVGSGSSSKSLIDVFVNGDIFNYHLGYKVVGILDTDAQDSVYKGVRIIRHTNNLPKFIQRMRVDEIVVDESMRKSVSSKELVDLANCRMQGIEVTALGDFYEELTGRVLVQQDGSDFYLTFPYNKSHFRRAHHLFSRVVDILFGIIGVVLCLLLIPFVYIANCFSNRGPLFYSQERVGLYGNTFMITKFRSMVVDAEANGAAWAQKNDSRITPFGKFLRRSRIDELPQAWSVLKGEMSLIGPRPERPVFVEQLKATIPFYETRHLTKPGITGWAQVVYKYSSTAEDALTKVQYDLYYLKNRSILMDLKVILKTISVIIRFKGV